MPGMLHCSVELRCPQKKKESSCIIFLLTMALVLANDYGSHLPGCIFRLQTPTLYELYKF